MKNTQCKKSNLLMIAPIIYPAKKGGGPIVSATNLALALNEHYNLTVLSNNFEHDEKTCLPNINHGLNYIKGMRIYFFNYERHNIFGILRIIKENKPDLIYLNGFLNYKYLIASSIYCSYLSKNCKLIIVPRGDFDPYSLKHKSIKKKIYIKTIKSIFPIKNFYWQATSNHEVKEIQEAISLNNLQISIIENLSPFLFSKIERGQIEKHSGSLNIVYLARIHHLKNTLKVIKIVKNLKGKINLDIYGHIDESSYWELCLKEINEIAESEDIKVIYKGVVDHDKVSEIYKNYHVMLYPTEGENFGHCIVEALSMGLPVVISNRTPWRGLDKISAGYDIELENNNEFIEKTQFFVDMNQIDYDKFSINARNYIFEKLNNEVILSKYFNFIDKILD